MNRTDKSVENARTGIPILLRPKTFEGVLIRQNNVVLKAKIEINTKN
jgi:hypothetical protein